MLEKEDGHPIIKQRANRKDSFCFLQRKLMKQIVISYDPASVQ